MIPYIMTGESLTVIINGKSLTMNSDNPSFKDTLKALKNEDYIKVEQLFDTSHAIKDYVDGNIEVKDGVLYYKGDAVHNYCVDKIIEFMSEELPYEPLLRFFEKLMENPSRRSVDELYRFLEHKQMPITKTGNFLAYKSVKKDYTDWYSGKFSNTVGSTLEMARNRVCDDAQIGCSYGFHAGSLEYAESFGNGGHLMVVEIDPKDVVSVPNDCDCQKLRTAKYKVVDHYKTKLENSYCDDYDSADSDSWSWPDSTDENSKIDKAYHQGYEDAKAQIIGDNPQYFADQVDKGHSNPANYVS